MIKRESVNSVDNELLLLDRIEVIKSTNQKYDLEHNAYLSFSGGKDSTLLHYLLDKALPDNQIPRVFIDTGIEYQMIREFVLEQAKNDSRFVIIKPSKQIKRVLEDYGYPFKSKEHSTKLHEWQQGNRDTKSIKKYLGDGEFSCPKQLRYQFSDDFHLKVSQFCCHKLKKEPVKKWSKQNNRPIAITGMRKEEGGQRTTLGCILTDKKGNVVKFHPFAVVSDEWENWFVNELETVRGGLILCKLYYPPYNFKRTGCCGCPFSLELQEQLETMERLLPNQRKMAEIIWQPVYEEYRRINYRLKKYMQIKLF